MCAVLPPIILPSFLPSLLLPLGRGGGVDELLAQEFRDLIVIKTIDFGE